MMHLRSNRLRCLPSLVRWRAEWLLRAAPLLLWALTLAAHAQGQEEYELPPIEYSASPPTNAISRLQARLDAAELAWPQAAENTEKRSLTFLLQQLDIPEASQVLVFSKTSLQRRLIGPDRPRALYFNEDHYVGWVPGGLLELVTTDRQLGLVFYQMDPQTSPARPRFQRDNECLSCHAGSMANQWPGLLIRSVFPNAVGDPITAAGGFVTGHESPIQERWGGWYVTGRHGSLRHMGNGITQEKNRHYTLNREAGANLSSLEPFFDTQRYLKATSDIVALMVLEHQVSMHNRLAQGSLRARKWLHFQNQLQKELGEPVATEPTGSAKIVIDSAANQIVEYLLFCDEVALPPRSLTGDPLFQEAFRSHRLKDGRGRSLKDFNLESRLFNYRCSYMIYSQAFDALPHLLKAEVYRRLQAILTAPLPPKRFAHLPEEERRAIFEILLATKTDLPSSWKTSQTP